MKKVFKLPFFNGFYNTIHDFNEDYILDSENLDSEDFEEKYNIDYKQYYKDYSKEYASAFNDNLQNYLKDIGIYNIKFKNLWSPKYYNYDTDEIYSYIQFDPDVIFKYLESNKKEFSEYLKNNNASYDGFVSFYDTEYNLYIDKFKQNLKNESIILELTQVIKFYINKINPGGYRDILEPVLLDTNENIEPYNYINLINN